MNTTLVYHKIDKYVLQEGDGDGDGDLDVDCYDFDNNNNNHAYKEHNNKITEEFKN